MKSLRPATLFILSILALCVAPLDAQEIAPRLNPFVEAHTLAGAVVLVADKDRVLDVEAVGYADIANNRAMAADSLLWIASQSKPITATAFMMLVDEGKVKLDDPVKKYLPEFGNLWLAAESDDQHILLKRPHRPITVRDVLTHTSGLPFSSAMETPTLDGLTLRDAARSYAMTPLMTEPGAKYQYSNAGINTAARIIEVVSGMTYEKFLESRLLQPLGMTDTTFRPTLEQQKRLAKPYKPDSAKAGLEETTIGQLRYPLEDPTRHPMPAGGLFSTAADVAKFCRMVLNGGTLDGKRYLSEESVREMTRNQTGPADKGGYGLGWAVNGDEAGHGGALATNMSIDRKRGLILVWMVQHAGYPGDGGRSQSVFREAAVAGYGR